MHKTFLFFFFLICLFSWVKDATAYTWSLKREPEDGKFYSCVFSGIEECNNIGEPNDQMNYFLEVDNKKITFWVRERGSDQELQKGTVYLLAKMASIELGKTEAALNLVKGYMSRCRYGKNVKDAVINTEMYERVVKQEVFPIVFEYKPKSKSAKPSLYMFYLHPDTEQEIRSLLKMDK
jgi:hypothetical protein